MRSLRCMIEICIQFLRRWLHNTPTLWSLNNPVVGRLALRHVDHCITHPQGVKWCLLRRDGHRSWSWRGKVCKSTVLGEISKESDHCLCDNRMIRLSGGHKRPQNQREVSPKKSVRAGCGKNVSRVRMLMLLAALLGMVYSASNRVHRKQQMSVPPHPPVLNVILNIAC